MEFIIGAIGTLSLCYICSYFGKRLLEFEQNRLKTDKHETVLMINIIHPSLKDKYVSGKLIPKNSGDSGFDLYFPDRDYDDNCIDIGSTRLIGLGIKCALYINGQSSPFYLYPRSSISKTPFRLANSVGIIDAGYRGELKTPLDCLRIEGMSKHEKQCFLPSVPLFQICTPTLTPIDRIIIVDGFEATERGEGGFGSTNKK